MPEDRSCIGAITIRRGAPEHRRLALARIDSPRTKVHTGSNMKTITTLLTLVIFALGFSACQSAPKKCCGKQHCTAAK